MAVVQFEDVFRVMEGKYGPLNPPAACLWVLESGSFDESLTVRILVPDLIHRENLVPCWRGCDVSCRYGCPGQNYAYGT